MIMSFHLLGRFIEAKAMGRASQAIRKLLQLEAKTARIIIDEEEKEGARDRDESLATTVEVLKDIRSQIAMGIELRDELNVLIRREGPAYAAKLCQLLGVTEEELKTAVVEARKAARIDHDDYKLKHHPTTIREAKKFFDKDLKPGEAG